MDLLPGWDELWIENGDVRLHVVAAGPAAGPLVILLHGFPEFWYGWRRQIPALAAAGFRVLVPDQRGYNLSSKPPGIGACKLPHLASDVLAVADFAGQKRFYLAGHDWGAAVAWHAAMRFPDRVRRLAILNVPHPGAMLRFGRNPRQLLRSWYMFYFQLPVLPEVFFRAGQFRQAGKALVGSSRPGTFSPDDLALYRQAWSMPGATTGMINWYRALFRTKPVGLEDHVTVPVRLLWGRKDRFLLPELAEASLAFCDQVEFFPFPEATHWLQHEEPAEVSRLLCEFFSKDPAGA